MSWLSRRVAFVVFCALVSTPTGVTAAPQNHARDIDAYVALLERYAAGDYKGAAGAALALDFKTTDITQSEVLEGIESRIAALKGNSTTSGMPTRGERNRLRRLRVRLLKLSLLLHTEASVWAPEGKTLGQQVALSKKVVGQLRRLEDDFRRGGPLGGGTHGSSMAPATVAESTMQEAERRQHSEWGQLLRFIRDWYLVIVARLHASDLAEPLARLVTDGLELFEDDPELLLAEGSIWEKTADSLIIDRSVARDIYVPTVIQTWRTYLSEAGDDYQRALKRRPDLHEAALRLGRVRGLLGNLDAAREVLERVTASAAPTYLRYVAWLFMGELAEEERASDTARAAYRRAVELMPHAQAPMSALSRLCDAEADAACARRWLDQAFAAAEPDRPDPWWLYPHGQAWLVEVRLERFRHRGLQP